MKLGKQGRKDLLPLSEGQTAMHSLSIHSPNIIRNNLLGAQTDSTQNCVETEPLIHHDRKTLFSLAVCPHDPWNPLCVMC